MLKKFHFDMFNMTCFNYISTYISTKDFNIPTFIIYCKLMIYFYLSITAKPIIQKILC